MENGTSGHLRSMNFKTTARLILLFVIISSFKFKTDSLVGIWMYQGEKKAYAKQRKITEGPCFIFKKDGKFIIRKNAGWCGTPPISYANFEGTYSIHSDSSIIVKYTDWRGAIETEWKISSLSKKWLKIKSMNSRLTSN